MINAENIQVFVVFHAVFISFTEVYDDIEDPFDPYTFCKLVQPLSEIHFLPYD